MEVATDAVRLVDHHAHGALRAAPKRRSAFEAMLGGSPLDSQLGFSVRRWCAPALGLDEHATAEEYWSARSTLGEPEVNRRLLGAAAVSTYLLDTGYDVGSVLAPAEHAAASGAAVHEVVRLESLAAYLLRRTDDPVAFVTAFPAALHAATRDAKATVGALAHRAGFDLDPGRPSEDAVRQAADRMLQAGEEQVTDPVLERHLLWCAIDLGLPVQVQCGHGDADLDLPYANPLLLSGWLRATEASGVPVVLLHGYPFHREAGYLARVFVHVHVDVGAGLAQVGSQARQVVAESLELAPFTKQLYSSDAWGPAELHLLGALRWRRAMAQVLGAWVGEDEWSADDALRVLHLIGHENAERLYRL
ncbi:hypothetical protein FB382_003560 [Nocardioides ginsengisegetis]|uniref:Amidohydrolase-related domain-containing protein n=1 Tax=Nocardioides ginsengisegetis TaxID=661491 RepID=A0A7W3J358_9ACTN|nr:amidohydrolase family protein [Nocardioides ginsengisegetis]MBA8805269.1 hypothetical protein [Nocardioides ginsengisegetis]